MKRDRQITEARRFKHPKSHVKPDGREELHGVDWEDRKFELMQRSRGQCEFVMRGEGYEQRCLREAMDPHHIVLRSVQGDDRLKALLAVCRHHHSVLDREQRKIHGKNKVGFRPEVMA